jgi:hypothetical protein
VNWQNVLRALAIALMPPANTAGITKALNGLQALTKKYHLEGIEMSAPTTPPDPTNPADQVSVSQSWIEYVAQTIVTANSVLGPYIQQLIAGESVTLDPANVTDVTNALGGLQGLEPAAPTPEPPTS